MNTIRLFLIVSCIRAAGEHQCSIPGLNLKIDDRVTDWEENAECVQMPAQTHNVQHCLARSGSSKSCSVSPRFIAGAGADGGCCSLWECGGSCCAPVCSAEFPSTSGSRRACRGEMHTDS
eukprot:m.574226 g.574226  ORF g.574226 m.574226 type:complete len:120 (+) comp57883_c0_seq45:480-839(+)